MANLSKGGAKINTKNIKLNILARVAIVTILLQIVTPVFNIPTAFANGTPPGDFPGFPTSYSSFGTDADENGCKESRNVLQSYSQLTSGFLFLRLNTENPAGWGVNTGSSSDARYKWFFDTTGNDGVLSGGNINNAEYMLDVEDPYSNGNIKNDGYGEVKFYSVSGNDFTQIGSTVVGSGAAAPSGPQDAYSSNFGYKISGNSVDMYVRMSFIGSPTSFKVFWATDNEDQNLKSSSGCDRPDSGQFISLSTLNVTGVGTGNGTASSAGITCTIAAGVATGDCSETYNTGTSVTLTATPNGDSTFDGWGGDCSSVGVVTMSSNKSCSATFTSIIPPTGTLSVKKIVLNDNGGTTTATNFSFQVNSGTAVAFESDGQNDLTVGVGSYTITEPAVTGYTTTYDNCSAVSVTNGGITICTITNDDIAPSLTLVKDLIKDNGGDASASAWTLTATGNGGTPTNLSGSTPVASGSNFKADTYTLAETGGPDGYTASGWVCVGGSQSGSQITLALGQSATCTITNDDIAPTVTISKTVVKNNGGGAVEDDFSFFLDGVVELFHNIATTITAGSYLVSESPFFGYTASVWSGDCASNGSITLTPGQAAVCTITNDDQPAILKVYKVVYNQEDGELQFGSSDFELSVDGINVSDSSFPGSATGTTVTLDAGSYVVSETGPANYNSSMSPDCSGTILVGETKECYVYNTSFEVTMGRIIVDKVTDPEADEQSFDFSLIGDEFNDDFSLADTTNPYDSNFVESGTYTLTEATTSGWVIDYISCTGVEPVDGSEVSFTVGAGDVVLCTVYNTKLAQIVVEKVTNPAEAQQIFDFTSSYSDPFTLTDSESNTSDYLQPGTGYSVIEGVMPAGWYQSSATCTGGNTPGNITLSAGDMVTCTFANNLETEPTSDLEVVKTVNDTTPDVGQQITYTITVSNNGPANATGVVVNDLLPSGVNFVSANASQGSYNNESGIWNVGNLDNENSATLTIVVTVTGEQGQTITNTVSSSAEQEDGNSQNSADSQAVTVNTSSGGGNGGNGGGGSGSGSGGGGGLPTCSIDATTVSVAIVGGENVASVTLNFTYPASVDTFAISNDSSFVGASFEPVVASKGWTLSSSSGPRTVYVRFHATGGCTLDKSASIGQVLGAQVGPTPQVLGVATCGEYLLKYIKFGAKNDLIEVKKLQTFLNEELGINLPITGFYGAGTRTAVNEFQLKYKNEILKPWVPFGLASDNTPTGYVYKTTKRWINMLKCQSLALPVPTLP